MALPYSRSTWSEMLIMAQVEDNNLITQEAGLVDMDTDYISRGSKALTHVWGIFNGLPRNKRYVQTGTTLTNSTISRKAVTAPIITMGDVFAETNIEVETLDSALTPAIEKDLMGAVGYWYQAGLISSIKGAFAASSASSYKYDMTSASADVDKRITFDTLVDVKGTHFPSMSIGEKPILVCHQNVADKLVKDIGTSSSSFQTDDKNKILSTGTIIDLAGLRIVINNDLCEKVAEMGTVDEDLVLGYHYFSYLCRPGALWLNPNQEPLVLFDQDIKTGGGTKEIAAYVNFCAGVAFANWKAALSDTPTSTQLETGTNWDWQIFASNNAKCIQIKSYTTLPATESAGT